MYKRFHLTFGTDFFRLTELMISAPCLAPPALSNRDLMSSACTITLFNCLYPDINIMWWDLIIFR